MTGGVMSIVGRRIIATGLTVVFFLFLALGDVWSDEGDEEDLLIKDVQGVAIVKNNDAARARDEAIRDALQKAVEEVGAQMIRAKAPGAVSRIAGADKYIRRYTITAERQEGVVYRIDVKAAVDVGSFLMDHRDRLRGRQMSAVGMTVRGIKKYGDYVLFGNFLKSRLKGCGPISLGRIEWQTARYDVHDCEGPQSIAEALSGSDSFVLDIRRISREALEVDVLNP